MTNQPKPEVKGIEQFRNAARFKWSNTKTMVLLSDYDALLAFAEEQQIYVVWWKKFAEDFESKKAAILELEAKVEEQDKNALAYCIRAHTAESRLKAMEEVVEAVKQCCLFADDDGIGVTTEAHISEELFERICIVLGRVG